MNASGTLESTGIVVHPAASSSVSGSYSRSSDTDSSTKYSLSDSETDHEAEVIISKPCVSIHVIEFLFLVHTRLQLEGSRFRGLCLLLGPRTF